MSFEYLKKSPLYRIAKEEAAKHAATQELSDLEIINTAQTALSILSDEVIDNGLVATQCEEESIERISYWLQFRVPALREDEMEFMARLILETLVIEPINTDEKG